MIYMVQAMIEIPHEANHILNIVKARYNLKTKSEAIAKIVLECGGSIIEPELRPEFVEKLEKIRKEGADAVLAKPFDYKKLLSSVNKLTK